MTKSFDDMTLDELLDLGWEEFAKLQEPNPPCPVGYVFASNGKEDERETIVAALAGQLGVPVEDVLMQENVIPTVPLSLFVKEAHKEKVDLFRAKVTAMVRDEYEFARFIREMQTLMAGAQPRPTSLPSRLIN